MRRRLRLVVLAVVAMVVIAFLVPLLVLVRVVAEDRTLSAAEQDARAVAGFLAAVGDGRRVAGAVDQLDGQGGRRVGVILADGTTVGAPVTVSARSLALARDGRAFTAAGGGGRRLLVPVRAGDGSVSVVVVWVPEAALHHGVTASRTVLAVVACLLVLLALVLADRLGRSTVASVERLGAAATRLAEGDLSARVPPDELPETAAVGRTINALAARIVEQLQAEREAVADLSHRLRTPLTALTLDAESLPSPDDRARMAAGVERVSQAVSTFIRAARSHGAGGGPALVDLGQVAGDRLTFWSALAEDQGRPWSWQPPGAPVPVIAAGDEVEAAVDALVTNVFEHTPDGTPFAVTLTVAGGEAVLAVEDDGPGMVLEPARGRSGGASTGLGLSIVRDMAERGGGSLAVGPAAGGGTRVEVRLPVAVA